MLTKSDLNQIRKVVREEIETEVSNTKKSLKSDILLLGSRVQNAISDLSDRTKNLEIGQKALDKKLDGVQEDISGILTAIDQHQSMLESRVDRPEEEVGISKN